MFLKKIRSKIEAGMPKPQRHGEEVEVTIQIDTSKMTEDQKNKMFKAQSLLHELGISFDTGFSCPDGIRDWEWDWSLSGPIKVIFRRFVKDNPENRYNRKQLVEDKETKKALKNAEQEIIKGLLKK